MYLWDQAKVEDVDVVTIPRFCDVVLDFLISPEVDSVNGKSDDGGARCVVRRPFAIPLEVALVVPNVSFADREINDEVKELDESTFLDVFRLIIKANEF